MKAWIVALLLSLVGVPAWANHASTLNPLEANRLISRLYAFDQVCKQHSITHLSCEKMRAIAYTLEEHGWCYDEAGLSGAKESWYPCKDAVDNRVLKENAVLRAELERQRAEHKLDRALKALTN